MKCPALGQSIADLISQWFEGGTSEQMRDEALAQIRILEQKLGHVVTALEGLWQSSWQRPIRPSDFLLIRKHLGELEPEGSVAEWEQSVASEKRAPAAHPGSGRLIQAYTPTTYPGRHENLPPPYVNFSEAKTPYEETILTVRSPHKSDNSAGDVAFIVITNYELQKLLLRLARWRGWLPMTEEQWQLQHYLDSPEEALRARERIEQLKRQRDEAQRIVEETTAALAGIPTPP